MTARTPTTPGAPANARGEHAHRDERGRWRRGVSGNPNGTPAGSRSRVAVMLDNHGEEVAKAILDKLVEQALDGNVGAAALLFDRWWRPRRGSPVRIALPPVEKASDLPGAMQAVAAAVADGLVSPEEGASLVTIMEAQRRTIESVELENRIRELERSISNGR